MKHKKALKFTSELYHQDYYFLKYWTRQQFETALGIDSTHSGAMTVSKDGNIYIWVDSLKGEGISHLAHECVHACNFTLGPRGVKISTKNDEAQAYLTQWIFNECYKSLKGPKL